MLSANQDVTIIVLLLFTLFTASC